MALLRSRVLLMVSLNCLSTAVKDLASCGSWRWMSGAEKMLLRYIQSFWQASHSSRVSLKRCSWRSTLSTSCRMPTTYLPCHALSVSQYVLPCTVSYTHTLAAILVQVQTDQQPAMHVLSATNTTVVQLEASERAICQAVYSNVVEAHVGLVLDEREVTGRDAKHCTNATHLREHSE